MSTDWVHVMYPDQPRTNNWQHDRCHWSTCTQTNQGPTIGSTVAAIGAHVPRPTKDQQLAARSLPLEHMYPDQPRTNNWQHDRCHWSTGTQTNQGPTIGSTVAVIEAQVPRPTKDQLLAARSPPLKHRYPDQPRTN